MLAPVYRELRSVVRERTLVSVVLLIVFVAAFSSVVTIGLLYLSNPELSNVRAKIAVVGECVIDGECMGYDEAMEAFESGEVDAVVIIGRADRVYVRLVLPSNDFRAVPALVAAKKELLDYQNELRKAAGIPTLDVSFYYDTSEIDVPKGSSTIFKFVYLVLIPLLCVTTAIVAAGMVIDSVCEEFERGTVEVLAASPVSCRKVAAAKLLSPILLASLLTVLWLALLAVNRIYIYQFHLVFAASLSISVLFASLAFAIAAKLKDRERSQFVFSIIAAGLLPLLLSKPYSPAVIAGRLAAGSAASIWAVLPCFAAISVVFIKLWDQ